MRKILNWNSLRNTLTAHFIRYSCTPTHSCNYPIKVRSFFERCNRKKCCWEIASSNPDDATAIWLGVKRAKLAAVSGWEGWLTLSLFQSVRHEPIVDVCKLVYAEQGRYTTL